MILADTSVLIDYLKGTENEKTGLFQTVLDRGFAYGISSVIYLELLQGTKTENEFQLLKEYLVSLKFYELQGGLDSWENAARMSFLCRRARITVRSTVDFVIAQIAVEHELELLHNDADFDRIASAVPDVRIFSLPGA